MIGSLLYDALVARKKFPQFTRFFSASPFFWASHILLWTLLVGFVTASAFGFRPADHSLVSARRLASKRAAAHDAHVTLARSLWEKGYKQDAQRELAYAQSLGSEAVLGTTTDDLSLDIASWEKGVTNTQDALLIWEQATRDYPEYRDAWRQAAKLSYQLSLTEKSRDFAINLLTLDPANPWATKILEALGLEASR